MRFDIRHTSRFTYEEPVRESQNELRAAPCTDARQHLLAYRVVTHPASRVHSFTDYFGTRVDAFGIRTPHSALEVIAEAAVEVRPVPPPIASPRLVSLTDRDFLDEHREYLSQSPMVVWGDAVATEAAAQLALVGDDVVSVVLALHRRVGTTFTYLPGSTEIGADVEEVLGRREGVCQDYAHVVIAMCRSVGVPARYVSGYLFTVDDATGLDTSAEAVEVQTHAWLEVAIPGGGWWALDPTNQQAVGPRHVTVGRGRDYSDVPPLRGAFSGAVAQKLDVSVSIRRHSGEHQQQQQQQAQQQQ